MGIRSKVKNFCRILLMLLSFSWFSSLAEVLPCDSEIIHRESDDVLGSDQTIKSSASVSPTSSDAPQEHDCHAGACHFGHCSHGFSRQSASKVETHDSNSVLSSTPYSLALPKGSVWSLIKPPTLA
jgi:hypothetical protein